MEARTSNKTKNKLLTYICIFFMAALLILGSILPAYAAVATPPSGATVSSVGHSAGFYVKGNGTQRKYDNRVYYTKTTTNANVTIKAVSQGMIHKHNVHLDDNGTNTRGSSTWYDVSVGFNGTYTATNADSVNTKYTSSGCNGYCFNCKCDVVTTQSASKTFTRDHAAKTITVNGRVWNRNAMVIYDSSGNSTGKKRAKNSVKATSSLSVSIPAHTQYTTTYNANLSGTASLGSVSNIPQASVNCISDVTCSSSTDLVQCDAADSILSEPKLPGYTFKGWNTNADGSGTAYKAGDELPNANVTLYAQWEAKSTEIVSGSNFNSTIPSEATAVVFTDEAAPSGTTIVDVSVAGDGGVVAWLDGTTYKVSTQRAGKKAVANSDMSDMFRSKTSLKTIDCTALDTSNVTNMYYMFEGCSGLTQLDLSNLNTANVEWMSQMFANCSGLTKLDLSSFNTANVTSMGRMFYNCKSLTEVSLGSNFAWVGTEGYLPAQSSADIKGADGKWYNKETNVGYTPAKIPSNTAATYISNFGAKSTELISGANFNSTIPSTATTVVFTDEAAPSGATIVDVSSAGDGGVVAWLDGTTYKVSTQRVGKKAVANSDMAGMFKSKTSLKTIDFTALDTSKVTSMNYMFFNCSGLTTLDVSSFNTANVTTMPHMFVNCSGLTTLDVSSFNTSNVTTMDCMFEGCSGLTTLDVSSFNTANVTTMSYMFSGCSGLTTLDVSSFNTSNVTNMSYMFKNCSGLTTLNVSSLNTAKVTTMNSMFRSCKSLASLDISGFDASNVVDMDYMFGSCTSLTSLEIPFSAPKVTDMNYMFIDCSNLETLDASGFITGSIDETEEMFAGCTSLKKLDISGLNTENVYMNLNMFTGCNLLEEVTIGENYAWNAEYLPTQSSTYIPKADGLWYDKATGTGYEASSLPDRVAATYIAYSLSYTFSKVSENTTVTGVDLVKITPDANTKAASFNAKLKHGQTFKILGLGDGAKYRITEDGTKMYAPSYTTSAENATRSSASAESGSGLSTPEELIGKDAVYDFLNSKSEVTGAVLTIRKELAGDLITDEDKDKEFTFKYHIEGLDPDIEYPVYLPGASESNADSSLVTTLVPNSDGTVTKTFTMKAGDGSLKDSYRIYGMPVGATFYVEEITRTSSSQTNDFDIKYKVEEGIDTTTKDTDSGEVKYSASEYGLKSATETFGDENISYVFINSKAAKHSVTIEKKTTYDGIEKPSSMKYPFELAATDLEPNKTYTSTDGSVSFATNAAGDIESDDNNQLLNSIKITLTAGNPITFNDVPGTAKFSLLERGTDATPLFTLKDLVTGKTISESSGTYGKDSSFSPDAVLSNDQLLTITNRYNSTAYLQIKKTIDGTGANEDDTFTGKLELKNLEAGKTYDCRGNGGPSSITADANGECTVDITFDKNTNYTLNSLPTTALFKLTEDANSLGYTPSYTVTTRGGISVLNKSGEKNESLESPWETLSTNSTYEFINTRDVSDPVKTVSDNDNITADGLGQEKDVAENTVESRNSIWTYTIRQDVPAGSTNMSVTDYLPPYIETILSDDPDINMVHAKFIKKDGSEVEGNIIKTTSSNTDPDTAETITTDVYSNDAFEISYNAENVRAELTAKLVDNNLLAEGGAVEFSFDVYLPAGVTVEDLADQDCVNNNATKLIFKNVADVINNDNLLTTNDTVTNVPLTSGLTVMKNVLGSLGDKNKDFSFTAEFSNLTPSETYTILRPETVKIDAEYDAATFTARFTAKVKDSPKKDVKITIYKDDENKTKLATITTDDNGKAEIQLSQGDYIAESGSVEQSFVIDTSSDNGSETANLNISNFQTMKVAGSGEKTTFTASSSGNATVSFKLKHDNMIVFNDLNPGASYNVTENAETQYTASYVVQRGSDTVVNPTGENLLNNRSLSTGINTLVSEKPVSIQFNNAVNTKDVTVSKVAAGSSEELPGAKLSLKNKDGDVIESWTSTGTAKTLTVAYDSEYTLTEDASPAGYEIANDINFRITSSGVLEIKTDGAWTEKSDSNIVIVDELTDFDVKAEKRNERTKDLLAGAVLAIKNMQGKTITTWTSSGDSSETIKLPMGTYTLTEVTAPDGFVKADDIVFTVNNEGKLTSAKAGAVSGNTVIMYDEEKPMKVTVTKSVKGNLGNTGKKFGFTAEFSSLNPNTAYEFGDGMSFISNDSGNATVMFSLKTKESMTFNLPVGAKYKFTEDASNHKASFDITSSAAGSTIGTSSKSNTGYNQSLATGTETADKNDGDITVTFTNRRDLASITGIGGTGIKLYSAVAAVTVLLITLVGYALYRKRNKTSEE